MAAIPTSQPRPFIPAPGTVAAEMVYTQLGQVCENVYHIQRGTTGASPTGADMDAIAALLEAWEHNTAISLRSSGVALTKIRVRDLTVQGGLVKEYTPTTAVTGTGTQPPAPGNVTAAVKWQTGLGGRSHRGRTFHIGLASNLIVGNQLTTAMQAAMLSGYNDLHGRIVAVSPLIHVVVSYSHNKFWRTTAENTPITTCSVDINLDSQRRRLTGRGQ